MTVLLDLPKTQPVTWHLATQTFEFACPHCLGRVLCELQQLNCCIFRHGVNKDTRLTPLNPHLPKAECDRLVAEKLVYGCARPFRFVLTKERANSFVEVCDYI